jgi:ribosomal protein S20
MQKSISSSGSKAGANDIRAMISAIDKAAKRGIIHKNAANRRKARLNRSLVVSANPPAA